MRCMNGYDKPTPLAYNIEGYLPYRFGGGCGAAFGRLLLLGDIAMKTNVYTEPSASHANGRRRDRRNGQSA